MAASFGKLAIGIASLVMGYNSLRNGVGYLKEAKGTPTPPAKPLAGLGFATSDGTVPQAQTEALAPVLAQHMARSKVYTLEQRVAFIQGRVLKGTHDPQIYSIAREIVSQRCGDTWCIAEKDTRAEAKAIFDYMRKNVRYTSDSLNIDTFQNPILTLRMRTGDCDDFSATSCALFLSIGIPCRLKVIETTDSATPNHIYAQVGLPRNAPSEWVTADSSVQVQFGWEVPQARIKKAWLYPPLPKGAS